MSYDIEIQDLRPAGACPTCGHADDVELTDLNVTYNIRPMLDHAGITFQDLEKLKGLALLDRITELLNHLRSPHNHAALRALNPPNGWGSHSGLVEVVYLMQQSAARCNWPGMRLS